MYKIVFKTAIKTFIGLVIVLIIAFAVASLGFPHQMATFFEKLGNYSFATGYASLAYTYSGKYEDLARCVDDSILSEDDANIVNYASRMINSDEFEDYCKMRDDKTNSSLLNSGISADTDFSYKQYILGNLACAQYSRGFPDDALHTAEKALEEPGFPRNNAYEMLARRAFQKGDSEMKATLKDAIEKLRPLTPEEETYRKSVLEMLES